MSLTRTIITIACILLFVTGVFAEQTPILVPRFITQPSASATISAAEGFSARVQASGSLKVGGGIYLLPALGLEVYAGIGATTSSRITGMSYYSGFSGVSGNLDVLWEAGPGRGMVAGPGVSWMAMYGTGHTFFFPSLSVGLYYTIAPKGEESRYLRLTLRHSHHFRKDLAYSSTTAVGLSFIRPWSP